MSVIMMSVKYETLDKHSTALISLKNRDINFKIMKIISMEREALVTKTLSMKSAEFRLQYITIRDEIKLLDECFSKCMNEYMDSMSYLEKYNDEFNSSPKWKRWMKSRQIVVREYEEINGKIAVNII